MTLVVEDGTGVVGAESYASVAGASAYWAKRTHDPNSPAWSAATSAKQEGALREASAYLDANWGRNYIGQRATATQGLLWPRIPVVETGYVASCPTTWPVDDLSTVWSDGDGLGILLQPVDPILVLTDPDGLVLPNLPDQIVTAAIELAVRALNSPLAPDIASNGRVKSEAAGGTKMVYDGSGPADGSYGFVGRLLWPVLDNAGAWTWR